MVGDGDGDGDGDGNGDGNGNGDLSSWVGGRVVHHGARRVSKRETSGAGLLETDTQHAAGISLMWDHHSYLICDIHFFYFFRIVRDGSG